MDKYEAVKRKFHRYRTMATKIQSLFRGRKVRKWFVGTLVAKTYREISNDGAKAFYVDTRTGKYLKGEPKCILRARGRFGAFWRDANNSVGNLTVALGPRPGGESGRRAAPRGPRGPRSGRTER